MALTSDCYKSLYGPRNHVIICNYIKSASTVLRRLFLFLILHPLSTGTFCTREVHVLKNVQNVQNVVKRAKIWDIWIRRVRRLCTRFVLIVRDKRAKRAGRTKRPGFLYVLNVQNVQNVGEARCSLVIY